MSEISALKKENDFLNDLFKLKRVLVKYQQLNEKLSVGDLRTSHLSDTILLPYHFSGLIKALSISDITELFPFGEAFGHSCCQVLFPLPFKPKIQNN